MITFTTICASIINFLVLCSLVTKFYLLPYMLCSCDFAKCRCDVDFHGILVLHSPPLTVDFKLFYEFYAKISQFAVI